MNDCFCSFLRIVSRMRAQNLMAGRVWSKYWEQGLEQAMRRMFELQVMVFFSAPTSPESPSSNWVRLPRADLRI